MPYSIAKIRKEIKKSIKENPKDCFRKLFKEYFKSWIQDQKENLEDPESLKTVSRDDLENLWDHCAEIVRDDMNEAYANVLDSVKEEPEKETS